MAQFYNSKGELTAYGLTCGYIEKHVKNNVQVTLWKEHNCYHVRQHNFNTGKRVFWHTTETLTEARKIYNQAKKGL